MHGAAFFPGATSCAPSAKLTESPLLSSARMNEPAEKADGAILCPGWLAGADGGDDDDLCDVRSDD